MSGIVPSGNTDVFPVLGDPIAQVRSPAEISRIFAARGRDAIVVPMHTPPLALAGVLKALHLIQNVGGALITVPHKRDAFSLCLSKTERADFLGSVNVMRRTHNGWHGDNTDGVGYLDGIERKGFNVDGRQALLIGCGGAGAAIAMEILRRGAVKLAIHDIDSARLDEVVRDLSKTFPGRVVTGSTDPTGFDLVANATPMGMRSDDPQPIDVSRLEAWQFVACAITKPEISPLIEAARICGCATMTGVDMFDAQAETLADFLLGNRE